MMLKIKKYINLILSNIRYYGVSIFFYKILTKISLNRKIKKYFLLRHKHFLEKSICKRYDNIIGKYKNKLPESDLKINNKIIWFFWWQGIENAPNIVKDCVNSLKFLNKDYKLIIISKHNINEYIEIEEYIVKKFNEGKIGLAHFSDVIRVNLLAKYGGIWSDSTIFVTNEFDYKILEYSLYSIKSYKDDTQNVSQYRWTTYFLCAKPNNELICFLKDLFNEYYKDNDFVIDYFMMDYFIDIAYNEIDYIKAMIDNIPNNNTQSEKLVKFLNFNFNKETYDKIIRDTYIHKLSYKIKLLSDEDTFYNKVIKKLK